MNCSNCGTEIKDEDDKALVVAARNVRSTPAMYAVICGNCTTDVVVMKVVLARPGKDAQWTYEGYLPVQMAK